MISLWLEGYRATCESVPAEHCGDFHVSVIEEAITEWCYRNPDAFKYVDMKRKSYWGRKFYDNEVDARRVYG